MLPVWFLSHCITETKPVAIKVASATDLRVRRGQQGEGSLVSLKKKALLAIRRWRNIFHPEKPICACKHKHTKVRGRLIIQVGQNAAESCPAELDCCFEPPRNIKDHRTPLYNCYISWFVHLLFFLLSEYFWTGFLVNICFVLFTLWSEKDVNKLPF